MKTLAWSLLALLVCVTGAEGATYYVDASCPFNGTGGTTQTCASGPGGVGAFSTAAALQTLLASTITAGDIVLIKNGTYATVYDGTGDESETSGFVIGASGTAGNPIQIMNYPGHSPVLTNCPIAQSTYCTRATITSLNRTYIEIKSNTTGTLAVKGAIYIYGGSEHPSDSGGAGIVIAGLDLYEGWAEPDDGNWAALFIDGTDGVHIHHNYIHDIQLPGTGSGGPGGQSSGTAIKLYFNSDALVEYNTIKRSYITSPAGGIDDKEHAKRNIYRYNWIEDVFNCIRWNSQVSASNEAVADSEFYGNICIGWDGGDGNYGVKLDSAVGTGNKVYNNTFWRFAEAMNNNALSTDPDIDYYNNIFSGGGETVDENVELYRRETSPGVFVDTVIFGTPTDYNAWVSGERWVHNGTTSSSLGTWQTYGFDAHSHQTACTFTNAPTTMTLNGGTCVTGGRVGGVSGGATIEQGAYGVTDCVGHTCGDSEPEPEPNPPSTVIRLRFRTAP